MISQQIYHIAFHCWRNHFAQSVYKNNHDITNRSISDLWSWSETEHKFVCLFCFWDYPDYFWQINPVSDTYPCFPLPQTPHPSSLTNITFYPESSDWTGAWGSFRAEPSDWRTLGDVGMWQTRLTLHWLRLQGVGGDSDNECAEDTCLQWWGREEEWSFSGALDTVSFSQNRATKLNRYYW